MTRLISANFCLILFVLSLGFVSSCKDADGITLDNNDEPLMVNSADTLTVEASTFLLDALPTAATGRLLVGGNQDEHLGDLVLSSYFRLTNTDLSISSLPDNIQYDSLSLELYYDSYSYGDTTKTLALDVHRITEDIEPKELSIALEDDEYPVFVSAATLYSNQTFGYDPTPLGGITFHPRPQSTTDTLCIRLDDVLGRSLLDMAINNDNRLINTDDFTDFFKGLALIPRGESHATIGLQDSVRFRIHYSYERQSDGKRVEGILACGIGSSSYQYNHIVTDLTDSPLANLSYDNQELAASLTDYRTYLQGGSGIVTRLRFPSLRSFLNSGNLSLSKATLVIETDQSEIGDSPPPSSLVLMVANKYGTPVSLVQGSSGNVTAVYRSASQSGSGGNGKYEFNITDYVSNVKTQAGFDETQSLLLSMPTADLLSTVNKLRLATYNTKPAIKLNLLYVNF